MTAAEPLHADAIIETRWLIPVEPADAVLPHHSVVICAGRIRDILPTAEARTRYAAPTRVQLEHHALLPGLVNAHTHAAMTLLRGLADDLPLMEWLKGHIWPAESEHVSHAFVHDGTLLACAEMLKGGTTCFNDMYFFPEAAALAALRIGMRASIGVIAIDFPTRYAPDAAASLSQGLATRDRLRDEPTLSFCLAPHAPYTVGDQTLEQVLTYSEQLDLPIHIHLHETQDEIRHGIATFGARPLSRLQALGMISPNLLAVHAVHLEPQEIALLASHGAHAVHCPASNLKLASGFSPVGEMIRQGLNVCVGTDGAASNNRLDMFGEMRLAALLAKAVAGAADALPAHQAIRMATLGGALALGLGENIGSLVPGKAADMVAVELSEVEMLPCYDVVSHLVYVAGREHVTHVWVDGQLRVDQGRLTGVDPFELRAMASAWHHRLASAPQARSPAPPSAARQKRL
ncbi:MAG: TRZ/ATZ family hydrolase [Betaproteobacteria bacterium]|nr:TRZ/ATZ family hydrolase [Betaproteobacteria bacterium]